MFNSFLVSSENLIKNIKYIRLKNPNSKICVMVKANAYGVGVKFVVKTIDRYVDFYGVSNEQEARQVAKFSKKKILIVGALPYRIDGRFSYTCHSIDDIIRLVKKDKEYNIHLKINSGMNRFGFKSAREFSRALKLIKNSKLKIEGIFTHFATADEYMHVQFSQFLKFVKMVKKKDFNPIIHADNSIVSEIENHGLDMVRVGFSLYNKSSKNFSPVVKIKTKIVQVNMVRAGELVGYNYIFVAKKNMRVGIIPIGYADGFDLSYIGLKLNLNGNLCKVLNICMDCFMVDLTDTKLKKGDSIYILDDTTPLKTYADYSNSSEYEVMTKFSQIRANRRLL